MFASLLVLLVLRHWPLLRMHAWMHAVMHAVLHAVLQVTVFASLLVLDVRRLQQRRVDCVPCLQLGAGEPKRQQQQQHQQLMHSGDTTAAAAAAVAEVAGLASAGAAASQLPPLSVQASRDPYDKADGAPYGGGVVDDEPPYIGPSGQGEVDEHAYWSLQRVLQVGESSGMGI